MATLPKPAKGHKLALYIIAENDGQYRNGYFHLRAKLANIHPHNSETKAYDNCQYGGVTYGDFAPDSFSAVSELLGKLEVYSQGNNDDETRHLYGWQVRMCDIFSLDTDDAKIAFDILTTIDKRVAKEEEKYGRVTSYGQYVGRVARALGCDFILFSPPKGEGNGNRGRQWANGYEFVADSIPDGQARIDSKITQWASKPELVPA